jgi:hypothetical protein
MDLQDWISAEELSGDPFELTEPLTTALGTVKSWIVAGSGKAGWRLRRALRASGAQVICERLMRHRRPGSQEAAIGRVLIAGPFDGAEVAVSAPTRFEWTIQSGRSLPVYRARCHGR